MRPTRLMLKRIDGLMDECFLNLEYADAEWRERQAVSYARAAWAVALRLTAAQRTEALQLREVAQ